jgi:hypothetical protein
MAYNINKSNGDLLSIVEDGTADINTSSIALIGKNFPGYGEYLNENLIHIVENFANDASPANQLTGQLWYQTNTSQLKIWSGTAWVSAGRPNIVNDTISTAPHYLTFVDGYGGTPDFKVASTKGITYIPSTGNVGIGIASATSRLTVSTNSGTVSAASPNTNTTVHVHGDNGKNQTILFESYGGTGIAYSQSNASSLVFRRNNGTGASLEAVQNNDVLGVVSAQGYNGAASTTNRAGIVFTASETWTTGSNGTKIVFQTTPNAYTTSANAMSILGNKTVECYGNVNVSGSINTAGAINAAGDITAFYTSDARLKTNVQPIENALAKTVAINGVTFKWNDLAVDKDQTVTEVGVLAQELQAVLPEAVGERVDGYLAVRYEKIVPLLIEAIKELKLEIDALKKNI